MKISIIGSGVVGEATGIRFSMLGNDVIFHDIDREKLAVLREKGYRVTDDLSEAIDDSHISFLCIQTPSFNGEMDFRFLNRAIIDVARVLREKAEYHVVVVRSTVLPSTTRTRIIPLLEKYSQLKAGEDFGIYMNPEFLRQATALQDSLNPNRIVIGALEAQSDDSLERLYTPFKTPMFLTDLDTAEMMKYVANCFLASKISFFNEIHFICRKLGLDPDFISDVVSLDPRIGKYGIKGGRPFGGSCLPKDLETFIRFVEEKNLYPELLKATLHINNIMRGSVLEAKIVEHD